MIQKLPNKKTTNTNSRINVSFFLYPQKKEFSSCIAPLEQKLTMNRMTIVLPAEEMLENEC